MWVLRKERLVGQWWYVPLIPALLRQRQMDLCEFKASLVYRVSSRTGSIATEKPCLRKRQKKVGEIMLSLMMEGWRGEKKAEK